MHSYRALWLILMNGIMTIASILVAPESAKAQQTPRLVESVEISGNRRLRRDDILYYVQTRPGDPYNEQQVQRDYQAILALGFFDKTATRVVTEDGARGGVNIIFEVRELPIIRDLQFEGMNIFKNGQLRGAMKYVKEAGLITRFRGQDILDREKLEVDLRAVDNYMRSKGYLQARHGEPRVEGVGPRRTGFPILPIPFLSSVDEGLRVIVPISEGKLYRIGELKVEGNSIFSESAVRAVIGLNKGDVANGEKIGK